MSDVRPTTRSPERLGISLSGGGVRAVVFHLGVLSRLAADNLLSKVSAVSTVSGGSLITGLILSLSQWEWPSDHAMLHQILPTIKSKLVKRDLQGELLRMTIKSPWTLFGGRAAVLAKCLKTHWGIDRKLGDMPISPRWFLNATTYESGKNWRFSRTRMGDYKSGYVLNPQIAVADAMAASAAYPGLIGPLVLKTGKYEWIVYEDRAKTKWKKTNPKFNKLHLWDGGVYDNLGTEAIYKPGDDDSTPDYDFLIVSDATKKFDFQSPSFFKRAFRLVDIAMDQVRGLRARMVVTDYESGDRRGVYLKIGNSTRYILGGSGIEQSDDLWMRVSINLSEGDCNAASAHTTDLKRLSSEQFSLLFRHGWEVTDITLCARHPSIFAPKDVPEIQ